MDPPGSSAHGILYTRILEWVAISSSGDEPNSGIEPTSAVSSALAGRFFTPEPPGKPPTRKQTRLCPLRWKRGALTTGLPGKCQEKATFDGLTREDFFEDTIFKLTAEE